MLATNRKPQGIYKLQGHLPTSKRIRRSRLADELVEDDAFSVEDILLRGNCIQAPKCGTLPLSDRDQTGDAGSQNVQISRYRCSTTSVNSAYEHFNAILCVRIVESPLSFGWLHPEPGERGA